MTWIAAVVGALAALLWAGQALSAASFEAAQRLGLQESGPETDPLLRPLERNAALWDALCLWTGPAGAALLLAGHPWGPPAALVGGAGMLDPGGREAAKALGLRAQGVAIGSRGQRGLAFGVFAFLVAGGAALIGAALGASG